VNALAPALADTQFPYDRASSGGGTGSAPPGKVLGGPSPWGISLLTELPIRSVRMLLSVMLGAGCAHGGPGYPASRRRAREPTERGALRTKCRSPPHAGIALRAPRDSERPQPAEPTANTHHNAGGAAAIATETELPPCAWPDHGPDSDARAPGLPALADATVTYLSAPSNGTQITGPLCTALACQCTAPYARLAARGSSAGTLLLSSA
jgi:hypothetical protein